MRSRKLLGFFQWSLSISKICIRSLFAHSITRLKLGDVSIDVDRDRERKKKTVYIDSGNFCLETPLPFRGESFLFVCGSSFTFTKLLVFGISENGSLGSSTTGITTNLITSSQGKLTASPLFKPGGKTNSIRRHLSVRSS